MKFWRHRKDEELDAEIRSHLDEAIRDRIARGESAEEARANAMREFGNVGLVKEVTREMWGWVWLEQLGQDLRFGVRMLRKQPGFSLIAILTMALGIGANTAIFSIIDTLLLRAPAHVVDVDQLVRVYPKGEWQTEQRSFSDYTDLRAGTQAFSALAAYQDRVLRATGRGLAAREIAGVRVTASFFTLCGVKPELGRFFTADEDRLPNVAQVVVISHELWQDRFGGAPEVIGKPLDLGERSYTIIGVAPPGFTGVELARVDFWYPINTMYGEEGWKEPPYERGSAWLKIIARLKPGVGLATAEAEVNQANQRGWASSQMEHSGATMRLGPVLRTRDAERSKEVRVTLWLVYVAASVLLIACANVANLLLTRLRARQREIAVRLALGASRWRIVRQFLIETALLSLAGSLLGVWLAAWLAPLLHAVVLPENAQTLKPDLRLLAFNSLAAILTAVACGLAPAWQASRINLNEPLKVGAGRRSPQHARVQVALLVGQVALAFVLLIGAGLFVRSLRNVSRLDLGIETEKLLILTARLDLAGYDEAQCDALWQQMRERVRSVPGVASVTLTTGAPFRFGWPQAIFNRAHQIISPPPASRDFAEGLLWCITPDFFQTTGIRLLRGRNFNEMEPAPVVILNETLARQLGQGREMLGEFVHLQIAQAPLARVVGITTDAQTETILGEKPPQYYVPFVQPLAAGRIPYRALLIRSSGQAAALTETVRREMYAALPGLPYLDVSAMRRDIEPQLQAWRIGAHLFSLLGLLALSISSVGVYSLLAYSVAQRTQEIGVRLALGAQTQQVLSLVIRQGLAWVVVGLLCGMGLALVLTRLIASQLYGVSATDSLTFAVTCLLLVFVGLLACWIPARRATRVDPLIALRHE